MKNYIHKMPRKIPAIACLLILLSISFVSRAHGEHHAITANEALLSRLDSILLNHFKLIRDKENRIDGLRESLHRSKSNSDRLAIMRQLYDEYLVYDSDSALHYATESRFLAERTHPEDYNLITEWKLNQAFIYTVQGLFDQTLALTQSIDSKLLNPETKADYFNTLAYLYSMRATYIGGNQKLWEQEAAIANQYRDSIYNMGREIGDDWLWIPIAMTLDKPQKNISDLDISEIKKLVDNTKVPSRQNAINSYWLSRYYEEKGDLDLMLRYKTIAAIYDAQILNREIAALQEIATFLFDNGSLNRAYTFLIYAVNQANLYHNRYRIVALSDVTRSVRDKYREELDKRDKRLRILVVLLGVLALILLGSVVFIIMEFNKLKKTRNLLKTANQELNQSIEDRDKAIVQLEESNSQLHLLNNRLHEVNNQLQEANSQKIGLLAYAFKLSAQYINTLEDYRKKLLKKYKSKRFDELGILINDPEFIKEHYQGFYESFDKMVLSLFPNFIEDYNSTAPAEAQVSPEAIMKTKSLNTRLRIFALRKLGVSKSSDIATMLNVSIRTVYNNRISETPTETDENND